MKDFDKKLEKYADLVVNISLNIQKGKDLVITAPIESADFVRKVARSAYAAGAKKVHVDFNDEDLHALMLKEAPEEALKEYPTWKIEGYVKLAEEGASFLSISSRNPDLLNGIAPERISLFTKTSSKAAAPFRKYTRDAIVSWGIVSVPSKAWASKVFPDLTPEESVNKLWEAIFMATRINLEDPIKAWKDHINNLNKKLDYFNKIKFTSLHYKAPGTDLTIELHDKHKWLGGGMYNQSGEYFIPNMPTEEIFTLPKKHGVNGVVKSTKPLNYSGGFIDNFTLTIKDGKIVDFSAETGYEALKTLIETDEGSSFLGEVALVPHDSPISNSNLIFYNTLYDENASCHLAIGMAYPLSYEGGEKMSKEEREKANINCSMVHEDFMIGSKELDIDGYTSDGKKIPVFRNGNWA